MSPHSLRLGANWQKHRLRPEEVPGAQEGRDQVTLRSLEVSSSVNALVPGQGLQFPNDGLVVVYGDNGSGKSGFARLMKDVARSRHREDVLSDIFSDKEGADQHAEVEIAIGGVEQTPYRWPGEASSELRQIGYFDAACGDAYLAADSDVMFRPAGVFLLDGLIEVCDGVRAELDRLLQDNTRRTEALPEVCPDGAASKFLAQLSADTTTASLDAACAVPADASRQLEHLRNEESRLRISDPNVERQRLLALADHYEDVGKHFSNMKSQLSPTAIQKVSATQAEALPGQHFPEDADTCVLCHQTPDDEARDRFGRFEAAVRDETGGPPQNPPVPASSRRARLSRYLR